ncbi:hypothetical protein C8F04DRAFT_1097326 [Mycena alexandri]|uniref:Uncharacterized protein n=1 Tax=Mycena alexandri TaxID=1745969 RepID=A0AAD6RW64_9AGAR|nr:hypothetical protein C8F04DRAFT_610791 [Mycena alexandri]KAJ7035771.1 hypothetical protein C8F04DRAFT_1097326 [Mycena alexandri]
MGSTISTTVPEDSSEMSEGVPHSQFPSAWLEPSTDQVISKAEWNRFPPGNTINEADYEIDWNAWLGLPYLIPGPNHPKLPLFHVFLKEYYGFNECIIPVAYFRGDEMPLIFTVAGPVDQNGAKPFYCMQYHEEFKHPLPKGIVPFSFWGFYSSVSQCFREFDPAVPMAPHTKAMKRLSNAHRRLGIPLPPHPTLPSTYILTRLADDPIQVLLTGFPACWLEPSADVYIPKSQWNRLPGGNNPREWSFCVDWDPWTGNDYLLPSTRKPTRSLIHIFLKEYFGIDECIIPIAFFTDDPRKIKLVFTIAGPVDQDGSKPFYCVVYPDYFRYPEGLDDGPWLWLLGRFSNVPNCFKGYDSSVIASRVDGRERLEKSHLKYNIPSPFPAPPELGRGLL